MNCYNHNEVGAVGICKHCNKGICKSCLVDTGDGIACSETCVNEVEMINQMINRNKKMIKEAPANWSVSAILYLLLGVIFLMGNFFYFRKSDPILIGFGMVFLGYSGYLFFRGRSFKNTGK